MIVLYCINMEKDNNRSEMLDSYEEVINILKSLDDCYYTKSNFVIYPKLNKVNIRCREPFCKGFIDNIELRNELIKRLNKLEKKEKIILLLYYTFGKPIKYIEQELHFSCRQCYRVKKQALEKIINFDKKEKVNTS